MGLSALHKTAVASHNLLTLLLSIMLFAATII